MDFSATIDLIIKDLREAAEIIDDLKKYPGVPEIQIELAKSKCKSAGEIIAFLKNFRMTSPGTADKIAVQPEIIAAEAEAPVTEKQQVPKQTSGGSPRVSKKNGPRQTTEKITESSIIADKFSHLSNKLNEQLGNLREGEDDVTDYMKAQPLTNLSEAIGVNDKFLFIREIFDGNQESYNQAISRLDKAESLADARALMMSYTGDDKENNAANLLLELLKRKFPADE
jgi:hypothetical protein